MRVLRRRERSRSGSSNPGGGRIRRDRPGEVRQPGVGGQVRAVGISRRVLHGDRGARDRRRRPAAGAEAVVVRGGAAGSDPDRRGRDARASQRSGARGAPLMWLGGGGADRLARRRRAWRPGVRARRRCRRTRYKLHRCAGAATAMARGGVLLHARRNALHGTGVGRLRLCRPSAVVAARVRGRARRLGAVDAHRAGRPAAGGARAVVARAAGRAAGGPYSRQPRHRRRQARRRKR